MLNISSILNHVLQGLKAKLPRYTVLNDEHVLDTHTGVEYHLYDDYFKATRDDEVIMRMDYFTNAEQEMIWAIKQEITDPKVSREKQLALPITIKEQRKKFSHYYENPEAVLSIEAVQESDTTEYTG